MRLLNLALITLTLTCSAVPVSARTAGSYRSLTAEYQRRNPVAEANQNFQRGKIYIIAAMGVGRYFPGIESHRVASRIEKRYGVRYLKGTSDAIESKAHLAYVQAAVRFAAAYNRQTVNLLSGKRN